MLILGLAIIAGVSADVNELYAADGSGYKYDKPSIPFPPPPKQCTNGGNGPSCTVVTQPPYR